MTRTALGLPCLFRATPVTLGRISWSTSVLFDLTAVLTAQRIVRLLPAGDPARRFWRAYGFAASTRSLRSAEQIFRAQLSVLV